MGLFFAQFGRDSHRNKSAKTSTSRAILSGNGREIFQRRERNRSQPEDRRRDSLQATEDGWQKGSSYDAWNGSPRMCGSCSRVLSDSGMTRLWSGHRTPDLRKFGWLRASSRKRIRPLAFSISFPADIERWPVMPSKTFRCGGCPILAITWWTGKELCSSSRNSCRRHGSASILPGRVCRPRRQCLTYASLHESPAWPRSSRD